MNYQFVCYICGFIIVIKLKNQLTKIQKKKNTNFLNRLTYAKPKIISICIVVDSLVDKITFPNNINQYDKLGAVLTYLKQKEIKNNRFDFRKTLNDMPDDFESNPIS